MQTQVKKLYEMGAPDTFFISLDSTPIMANTKQNNPKSFVKNKHDSKNQPKADSDCALAVYTTSNQHNERNFEFYWGYKNHIRVDCITGLPVCEVTTTADVADSTVASDILKKTSGYLSIEECSFIADKAYDVRTIYNTVHDVYHGDCTILLNKRNTKNPNKIPCGAPICEAGLSCTGTESFRVTDVPGRNTVVLTGVHLICMIVHAVINVSARVPKPQAVQNM